MQRREAFQCGLDGLEKPTGMPLEVEIPDVGLVEFQASMSKVEIEDTAMRLYDDVHQAQAPASVK